MLQEFDETTIWKVESATDDSLNYGMDVKVEDSREKIGTTQIGTRIVTHYCVHYHYEHRHGGTLNFADVKKIRLHVEGRIVYIRLYGAGGKPLIAIYCGGQEPEVYNKLLSDVMVLCRNVQ
jgi:hypothetical protein